MNRLTRNVERQVLRIDHTLHEAQIFRKQVLVVFVDEDVARVQFQAIFLAQGEDATLRLGRDIQERVQLHRRICDHMRVEEWVFEIKRGLTVKILILFFGDLVARRAPERSLLVDWGCLFT